MSCLDHTPSGVDTTVEVQGLNTFGTALLALGAATPGLVNAGYACGNNVLCAGSDAQCEAGKSYMAIKQSLTSDTNRIYSCPIFARPGTNIACDPEDNNVNPASCVNSVTGEVTYVTPARMCNMDEFETYISGFSERLGNVFKYVDSEVGGSSSKITTSMFDLVDTSVIQPLMGIVDGSTCNFLGKSYKGMITALCFQGAYGLVMIATAYVWLAFLVAILIFAMYVLYRRSIDNVEWTAYEKKKKGQPAYV